MRKEVPCNLPLANNAVQKLVLIALLKHNGPDQVVALRY
jgi:hypothetical protein